MFIIKLLKQKLINGSHDVILAIIISLLDWDFPDSEARIYVNQYMSHKLIDPNTWEIKVSNISLRKKLEEIAS